MTTQMTTLPNNNSTVMLVSEAVVRRLRQEGRAVPRIDPDADLIELGLVDSQALLDIILDVEHESGILFDADGMEFEDGVTLRRLAAGFVEPA